MGFKETLLGIIISIPAAMIAFTAQGYAKALVADKLGDKTPRFQGRLTLNPIAHLDPIGFLMILLFHFGWTKPVETNPSAYKRRYKDSIKVSVAAPVANILVGFIGTILYYAIYKFLPGIVPDSVFVVLSSMSWAIVTLNIGLAIFTLLPLPGLAGFDIFRDLSPKNFYKFADKIYQYQFMILIGVILFGGRILSLFSGSIIMVFTRIVGFFFGI